MNKQSIYSRYKNRKTENKQSPIKIIDSRNKNNNNNNKKKNTKFK